MRPSIVVSPQARRDFRSSLKHRNIQRAPDASTPRRRISTPPAHRPPPAIHSRGTGTLRATRPRRGLVAAEECQCVVVHGARTFLHLNLPPPRSDRTTRTSLSLPVARPHERPPIATASTALLTPAHRPPCIASHHTVAPPVITRPPSNFAALELAQAPLCLTSTTSLRAAIAETIPVVLAAPRLLDLAADPDATPTLAHPHHVG